MKEQITALALGLALALGVVPPGAGPARAEGEPAGVFDYYVLALSWSPTWCALEGDARGSPQCAPERDAGWILHGLWPQFEEGWPAYCPTTERPPSRAMTGDMARIMGTSGLAWHQWKKHGTCSGLSAAEYYAKAEAAFDSLTRPGVFARLEQPVRLPASLVEEAFLKENPGLAPDMLTVTCRSGRIQEARLCLTRDLAPRDCGADVVRDCRLDDALMAPIP
ncbi:ribonuclease T2 [Roseivivax sp. GX 12232]|uniref:ribonuclease T2 n=1 Tax=Roseivivax sp. GX 12232 TaxID=2900547 RepID=UPI001E331357|nr:ribonuclease T2 [Roseivivax sp. GX 12232]MCE0504341.1 ribonuclease T2 [Roseivivax sp. GX 12232]